MGCCFGSNKGKKSGESSLSQSSAKVSGSTGCPTPQITITPSNYDFNNYILGSEAPSIAVTVQNSGNADLKITDWDMPGDDFEHDDVNKTATLQAGEQFTLNLKFLPQSSGAKETTLTITSNAKVGSGKATYRGKALVKPELTIEAPALVLVRKEYYTGVEGLPKAHRKKVTLKVAQAFGGTGRLRCNHAEKILLYSAEQDGDQLYDGKKNGDATILDNITEENLTQGYSVFVEGKGASDGIDDIQLKLELIGGNGVQDPAEVKLTCVELTLDIYKSPPKAGETPEIWPEEKKMKDGRAVVIQGTSANRLFSERARLLVRKAKPNDYAGKLELKAISAKVEVFGSDKEIPKETDTALAGSDLTFENDTIDALEGKKFFAQGKTLSDKIGDTGFTLALKDLADREGDRVVMSVLEAKLQICKPRTSDSADPDPLSEDDQVDTGRDLFVQDDGLLQERAKLIVSKVKPEAFAGKLMLSVWDATAGAKVDTSGDQRVQLFADEKAARGQTAVAFGDALENKAATFWVQGAKVSAADRDTQIRLGIQDVDQGCQRAALTLKNLKVSVRRHDQEKLSAAATLKVEGTTPSVAEVAADTDADTDRHGFIAAAGKYKITVVPKNTEATWTVRPDLNGEIDVAANKTVEAGYLLTPYKKVQLIGFNIKPGVQGSLNTGNYLGPSTDTADQDITNRCEIMKAAIQKAKSMGVDTGTDVLKLFMAPEFYFRGYEGGYPIEKISSIMDAMGGETAKSDYKDWLFVYGTAIGYQKRETGGGAIKWEAIAHESEMKYTQDSAMLKTNLAIKTVAHNGQTKITVDSGLCKGIAGDGIWKAQQNSQTEKITACTNTSGITYELTLEHKNTNFVAGNVTFVETLTTVLSVDNTGTKTKLRVKAKLLGNPQTFNRINQGGWIAQQNTNKEPVTACTDQSGGEYELTLGSKNTGYAAGNITLVEPAAMVTNVDAINKKITVVSKLCARIPPTKTPTPWKVHQGADTHDVKESSSVGSDTYTLTLDSVSGFAAGPVEFTEPIATEIFNIALVQKGGTAPNTDTGDLKAAVVYKENISPIDFIGANYGKGAFHAVDGSGRKIKIHQQTDRTVLPTDGSRDRMGASPNVPGTGNVSEINKSGLGGGSVFTIDGITFGLEVCLDHAKDKLHTFYANHAKPGDPKVQIHLIPSWGMSIGGGEICCLDNGPIFNVDGARIDSVARIKDGKYTCESHPLLISGSSGTCAKRLDYYVCITCMAVKGSTPGNCPTHTTTPLVLFHQCNTCGKLFPSTGSCSSGHPSTNVPKTCGKALQQLGTPLSTSATADVDLSALSFDWKKYFEKKEKLVVFEVKPIPDPEVV